jgi:hypothetical protein
VLIGNLLAAGAFALGTAISGYALVMVFGSLIGAGGVAVLCCAVAGCGGLTDLWRLRSSILT